MDTLDIEKRYLVPAIRWAFEKVFANTSSAEPVGVVGAEVVDGLSHHPEYGREIFRCCSIGIASNRPHKPVALLRLQRLLNG